jgi:PAS domain-containing protein
MFQTIFRAIPDPASISKLSAGASVDVLVDVNDALLELTGRTRAQMIGRTVVDSGFCDEEERIRLISNLLETEPRDKAALLGQWSASDLLVFGPPD